MSISETAENDARAAIAARSREFEARFAARDAHGLVTSYFVPDSARPIASPPGGVPPVEGRANIEAMFSAQFEVLRTVRLEAICLDVADDMAYELGRAHLMLRSNEPALGRYSVLWKRLGTEWRAKIDFFAEDGWPG